MAIILSILLVLVAGCSTTSYQKGFLSVLPSPLAELTPVEVFSLIRDGQEEPRTLQGEGNFYIQYQEGDLQGKGMVWASRDSFRLDIFDPFLQPVYVITYHERVLSVLSLKEKRLYRGVGLYNPISPFLFPLDPSLFLSSLFGEFPGDLFSKDISSFRKVVRGEGKTDMDSGLYLLEVLSEDGLRYKIWIQPHEKNMIRGETYDSNGNLLSSIKRERFEVIDGILFHKKITVEHFKGIVMSIDFRKLSLKEDIEEDVFRLSPPAGIKEVNILPFNTL